jgi:DNA-binding MarR family transcriptional regulator
MVGAFVRASPVVRCEVVAVEPGADRRGDVFGLVLRCVVAGRSDAFHLQCGDAVARPTLDLRRDQATGLDGEETPAGAAPSGVGELPSWLLTQTAAHAHRLVGEGLGELGARGYDYRVLSALATSGPSSQAMLGRYAGIHLSDLVATLNTLADQGYVERQEDPEDRRRNVVTITPAGRRHLRRLADRITRIQDDLLAPLSPDDRRRLTDLLSRLLRHHTQPN